jgi:serine/threonine protein kinase
MWSLGVILYVLLTGAPPFDHAGDDEHSIDFPADDVTLSARDLIQQLLQQDPRRRASVVSACQHPWILQDDGDTHVHPLDDPKLTNGSDAVAGGASLVAQTTSSQTTTNTVPFNSSPIDRIDDDPNDTCDPPPIHGVVAMQQSQNANVFSGVVIRQPLSPKSIYDTNKKPPVFESAFTKTTGTSNLGCSIMKSTLIAESCERQSLLSVRCGLAFASTPETSNHGSFNGTTKSNQNEIDPTTPSHTPVEEPRSNNDDLLSKFSDNTESVSSYSTENTPLENDNDCACPAALAPVFTLDKVRNIEAKKRSWKSTISSSKTKKTQARRVTSGFSKAKGAKQTTLNKWFKTPK